LQAQLYEQIGEVNIEEKISLVSISSHIHALVKDSGRRGHVQGMLEARMLAGEAMEVLRITKLAVEEQQDHARNARQKRNVLGDIISSITGLATQDSISQQQAYDMELRRKMEELVRTQQAEANTIEQLVGNLVQEEETLDGKLDQLQQRHKQDIAHLQQHSVRQFLVRQDLTALKSILASMQLGTATPGQVIRFTARMQTGIAHHFQFQHMHIEHDTLVATYTSALYAPTTIEFMQPLLQAWQVRTDRATYILHDEPARHAHITWQETRLRGGTCVNCTLLTHTGHGWYKVLREGWLNCTQGREYQDTLQTGQLIHIEDRNVCGNDVIQVHGWHGRHDKLLVDLSTDGTVDERILQKALANGSKIEDIQKVRNRHMQAQTQLHKHILTAQQEMHDLTEWADKAQQQWVVSSWTWHNAGIGMAIGITVGLIALAGVCTHRHYWGKALEEQEEQEERQMET
jgi:ElaB/YqjD/DUF883 family membrane-anchored ribosome-binding protein